MKKFLILITILFIGCQQYQLEIDRPPIFRSNSIESRVVFGDIGETMTETNWMGSENPYIWGLNNQTLVGSAKLSIKPQYKGKDYCEFSIEKFRGKMNCEEYLSLQSVSKDTSLPFPHTYTEDSDSIYIQNSNITCLNSIQNYWYNYSIVHNRNFVNSSAVHMYACAKQKNGEVDLHYKQLFGIIRIGVKSEIPTKISFLTASFYGENDEEVNCCGEYKLSICKNDMNEISLKYLPYKASNQISCKFDDTYPQKFRYASPEVRYFNFVVFPKNYHRMKLSIVYKSGTFEKSILLNPVKRGEIQIIEKLVELK